MSIQDKSESIQVKLGVREITFISTGSLWIFFHRKLSSFHTILGYDA
jgi:hypothetical protein